MCVGSVCTQPPYNDKNPPSVFFFNLLKSLPLSEIKPFSASCLCDVTQTKAAPTNVDWHGRLTLDLPWVSCHQSAIVSEQM